MASNLRDNPLHGEEKMGQELDSCAKVDEFECEARKEREVVNERAFVARKEDGRKGRCRRR